MNGVYICSICNTWVVDIRISIFSDNYSRRGSHIYRNSVYTCSHRAIGSILKPVRLLSVWLNHKRTSCTFSISHTIQSYLFLYNHTCIYVYSFIRSVSTREFGGVKRSTFSRFLSSTDADSPTGTVEIAHNFQYIIIRIIL